MIAKDITSRLARRFRGFRATAIGEFVAAQVIFTVIGASFVPLLFTAGPTSALAVDAAWLNAPISANWNSGTNWFGGIAPVNPGDRAIFNISSQTFPTLSSDVTVETIIFGPNASAFAIQVVPVNLILEGDGIVNNSENVQTIDNFGTTSFTNTATAGNATINNFGTMSFSGDSRAGLATINNNFGTTEFLGASRAGNATINNFGTTSFSGDSRAGKATINNNFGTTEFLGASRAGNATINNFGTTSFSGDSRAGLATITNSGDSSFTAFTQGASGGNAALINANPTAFISIAELDGLGTTVGSIAGNGRIFLGSKNLKVGENQQSTAFSGIISDDESPNLPSNLRTAQLSYIGGSLTKVGTGTLTLAGANTYTGGTTIEEGTILTQNASALGGGPVSFGDGATLEVQDLLKLNGNWMVFPGTATVNGGTVQTFGDFNLGGGGTLIANANFNVPGAASINSSGLEVNNQFTVGGDIDLNDSETIINGVLTAPIVNVNDLSSLIVNNAGTVAADVNVAQSAQLALFGRINGSVVNSGTVAPGASVGQFTVNGNYTQNASGALRIEVAGTGPSQHSLLAVDGRASLAGTLQLIRVGGFNLSPGDQVTFLTANKGVSGTFGTVQNDFVATGTVVKGEVVYLPDAVLLRATQGSFADPGIVGSTPIFVAVGNALDSAAGDPRAAALIGFLNNLPLSELPGAIAQIVPEEVTAVDAVGVSTANVQSTNLAQRMGEIHAGSSGFSSSGFSISGSGPSFSDGFAGVNGPAGKSGEPVFAPIPDNRWGVFITGIGEFTNVSSTFEAPGYDLATGGFTLGVDYRVLPNFAIGLTGGYAYTGISLADNGHIRVNGGKLGIYSTVFGSGFYLDTAVTGGLNGYKTRRTGLEGTANGSTEGGELNVGVAVGYDWKKGGLSIGPTASFQYTLVGFNGFTESGSLAPLEYHDQTTQSYRTAFGMKASYDWKVGPIRLIPQVRTAWQHEYGATDYSIVASFASGAGDSFTVNGPEIGRDSLLVSAGFAIQWNERITTYAYYDGEFFRTNYLSNNVSAGVRVGF